MSAAGAVAARFGRLERVSLAIALVWGIGLVAAALLIPAYQSVSVTSSGTTTSGSATLVGVNGWGGLLVAGAPLVAAVVTGLLLWRRAERNGAGVAAWIVAGLLMCFNLLAMLSTGVFVLPATCALVVACSAHGAKPRGVVTGSGATS